MNNNKDYIIVADYIFKKLADIEDEEKKQLAKNLKRKSTPEDSLKLTQIRMKYRILLDFSKDILNLLRFYDEADELEEREKK